ncbi:MAG: hypothetical protein M1828_002134 [Chrysothrix sp. TS-e1954]|nr:MAG: hypothetical protein M1828_002134 [Chrysothrix sp. TS-e1954]
MEEVEAITPEGGNAVKDTVMTELPESDHQRTGDTAKGQEQDGMSKGRWHVKLTNVLTPLREEHSRVTPDESFCNRVIPGYSPQRCFKTSGRPAICLILALAGISIMFFGYDASVMSQINTNPDYLRLMGTDSALDGNNRDAAAVGGLVSVWFAGFAIGALLAGSYANSIGRLRTMFIGALWGILGAALQASAQNITWMAVARVIGGIGCGHLNTIVPVWTSELAGRHERGSFVAVQFTLALTGSTMVYWMEYGLSQHQPHSIAWRFPLAFQIIFLVTILVLIPFYPESPRYLLHAGHPSEAETILRRCRPNTTEQDLQTELAEIRHSVHQESQSPPQTYRTMLAARSPTHHTRRRILLGCACQAFQKLTGIDAISTYAPQMFSLAGLGPQKSALLAGGNFISYTASLVLAIFLSRRLGRRTLMLTGSLLMGCALIPGGVLSRLIPGVRASDPSLARMYGAGVTAVLYAFTFLYGSHWLATCWVYPTEIFPLGMRARGAALSTVVFSLTGGVIVEIVPYLISAVGFWVFFIFAGLNFVMCVPIWLVFPETQFSTLEELEGLFEGKRSVGWRRWRLKGRSEGVEDREEVVGETGAGSRDRAPSERVGDVLDVGVVPQEAKVVYHCTRGERAL